MKNIDLNNIFQWPLKQQLLLFALIFFIVFYLGYYFDIASKRADLTKVHAQEVDLKQQLNMVVTKEKDLKSDIDRYSTLLTMLTEWKAKLIKYSQLPDLMNDILKIGANNHITFSLFKPKEEAKADPYVKVPIEIIAVGSYHQLADFISQVANMTNIVVINAFTFSNENKADVLGAKLADQANAQNLLTAQIAFEIYMQPEQSKS